MSNLNHNWIDAHCHLADPRFCDGLESALDEARAVGITGWVQGGVHPQDWVLQEDLKKRYGSGIKSCFGLHPWWVAKQTREIVHQALKDLEEKLPRADAMGEVGLDGMDSFKASLPLQQEAFRLQLELFPRFRKPLVLHIVRLHREAVETLKAFRASSLVGIVHSFSGDWESAKAYCELGFTLSISGSLLREGNHTLAEVVKKIPLEKLVMETDAPDQSPFFKEGKREKINAPKNLVLFAARVAEIKGLTVENVLDQSRENLKCLFKEGA